MGVFVLRVAAIFFFLQNGIRRKAIHFIGVSSKETNPHGPRFGSCAASLCARRGLQSTSQRFANSSTLRVARGGWSMCTVGQARNGSFGNADRAIVKPQNNALG